MSVGNINTVVTAIKAASDGLIVDGEYVILNSQVVKTGKINVRCAGTFGAATISVGYKDVGGFVVEDFNGSPADFVATFSLQFNCGEHTNNAVGPAIKVAGIDGTTDLSLTISSID